MDFKKVKKTTWAVCAMALTLVLLEITVTYCYGIIADGTSLSDTSTPLPLVLVSSVDSSASSPLESTPKSAQPSSN